MDNDKKTIIQVRAYETVPIRNDDEQVPAWMMRQGYVCPRCGCAVLIIGPHERVCHD